MGEVSRARDSKLKRDVAIKILPEAFARDAERVSRFEREAEVLASLNHANIATVHDFEQSAGRHFLVMELVDGGTLADRVRRGALPIDDALGIVRQIAQALEAAHQKGIVHRDLKPANIKIASGGTVKVLDFGLAKCFAGDGPSSDLPEAPTIAATAVGLIVGTAAYMSPEQARGAAVDTRTDIWALGCVLYEMLTGQSAFPRNSGSDTVAAVLREEPDWRRLPDRTPPRIRLLLERCVRKDPRQRLHDAADVRIELDDLDAAAAVTPPRAAASRLGFVISIASALAAGAAIASALWWAGTPRMPGPPSFQPTAAGLPSPTHASCRRSR